MHLATLAMSLALALAAPLAVASELCTGTCTTLVNEGNVLRTQGQTQHAIEKYQAAIAAAPQSTLPLLAASTMLLDLSWHTQGPPSDKLHDMAASLARQALRIDASDPMAQDVLRQIQDGPPVVLHQPIAAASQALLAAEKLYAQQRYDEARVQYERAAALDPLWSAPWVGAGDCYFGQKDWPHAEALFRRATEIEPRNAQAWRFLSDSLFWQNQRGPGEQALYSALAANPADRNSWGKLANARKHAQLPLASLHLQRGSSVTQGADGKYTINIDGQRLHSGTPEAAFALALAAREANARGADTGNNRSPYDIELDAWRTAFKAADEAAANGGARLSDPALVQMQAIARDGQLEPALLLLAYRPTYRPALDAWLTAHPDGIKAFVDRYGLQP